MLGVRCLLYANGCHHGIISTCLKSPLLIIAIALRKMQRVVVHGLALVNASDLFLDGLLVCHRAANHAAIEVKDRDLMQF